MRVAAYYAPLPDDPLHAAASSWLGRDAAAGAAIVQPAIDGIAEITAEARVYGFHATLKPPMRLADGHDFDTVLTATRAVAARLAPFDLPPLEVADIHGFLALRETRPCPDLQALSDACVAGLDACRAPPEPAELARRRRAGLTPAQDAMLVRWGYPYVFDTWFFHMTLSCRLDATQHARFRPLAEAHLARALAVPRPVRDICLFVQSAPGESFKIAARVALGAARDPSGFFSAFEII